MGLTTPVASASRLQVNGIFCGRTPQKGVLLDGLWKNSMEVIDSQKALKRHVKKQNGAVIQQSRKWPAVTEYQRFLTKADPFLELFFFSVSIRNYFFPVDVCLWWHRFPKRRTGKVWGSVLFCVTTKMMDAGKLASPHQHTTDKWNGMLGCWQFKENPRHSQSFKIKVAVL